MKKQKKPSTAIIPCPVILVSVAHEKQPNIITLSWAANVCSDPPSIAIGVRPSRYSYDLIKEAGDFVVNIPSRDLLDATVFCGTHSGREHNKFEECGLTPVNATKVSAPMIEECPLNIEAEVKKIISVGVHDLFIAEVVAVHMDQEAIDSKERLDLNIAAPFTYIPLTGEYWGIGKKIG
ncbi:flavin reductase family protein [Candidatus Thorarchaeota archaeon]|nr:MAG: flavin reductase family protein [Candidatus Thorarchaeota archaeon]